jgi:hypothetical protein
MARGLYQTPDGSIPLSSWAPPAPGCGCTPHPVQPCISGTHLSCFPSYLSSCPLCPIHLPVLP